MDMFGQFYGKAKYKLVSSILSYIIAEKSGKVRETWLIIGNWLQKNFCKDFCKDSFCIRYEVYIKKEPNSNNRWTRSRAAPLFINIMPTNVKFQKSQCGYGMALWNQLPADVRREEDRAWFAASIRRLIMEEQNLLILLESTNLIINYQHLSCYWQWWFNLIRLLAHVQFCYDIFKKIRGQHNTATARVVHAEFLNKNDY